MAAKQCLGIHIREEGFYVALVENQGDREDVLQRFVIKSSDECLDGGGNENLFAQLAQKLHEARITNVPVALSVGGRLYHSLVHHTEFSEDKNIRQTLRFDIEDEFIFDADQTALCYQRISRHSDGADLIVYTIHRQQLQATLDHMYRLGLDAMIAQPDIVSWQHYLMAQAGINGTALSLARSNDLLYMLVLDEQGQVCLGRTCMCPESLLTPDFLRREIMRCRGNLPPGQTLTEICFHAQDLDADMLAKAVNELSLDMRQLHEPDVIHAMTQGITHDWLNRAEHVDFRRDNLPPKTHVQARTKALLGLSGALTLLMVVWIAVAALHMRQANRLADDYIDDIRQTWSEAQPGQRMPANVSSIPTRLKSIRNKLLTSDRAESAQVLPESAGRTLMLLLQSLNQLPRDLDMKIETIRASDQTAFLSGSVVTLNDLEQVVDVFSRPESSLSVTNWTFSPTSGGTRADPTARRRFDMPLKVVQLTRQDEQEDLAYGD